MRVFFVLGAPKSGTTWLQTIMNSHPQVSCFGEGHFVEQVVLPMQVMMRRYNQKLAIVAREVYQDRPCYGQIGGEDSAVLMRQIVLGMIRRAGPKPNAIWWGDKTPGYSRHLAELDRLFPKCRFIDIIRDPRDVAVSSLHHGRRAGMFDDFENDVEKRLGQIKHAIGRWTEHVREVERARPLLGDRLLQVRYQALIEQPLDEIRRLFSHLDGVRVNDDLVKDIAEKCSFTTMSGGRQPGETDDHSFLRSGTVGQHRLELRESERAFIDELLA